ncbi:uncharacterized protein METZ01_LOCUS395210, partial [marine metagenome]
LFEGTIGEKTAPIIVGELNATTTYVSINYAGAITRADDLTLRYSFDEASGTTTADSSGGDHTGALVNGPTFVTGKFGNAISFDGSNDRIDVPFAAHALGTEVTIAFWSNGGSSLPKNTSVMESGNGNRALNIHFPWSNSNIYWDAGSNNSTDRINKASSASIFKGSWQHWAFTKNKSSGKMFIYLNGVQWHSGTGKTRNLATGGISKFRIGADRNGNNRWHGLLDDFRMYDKEMSASDVAGIYNNGNGDSVPFYPRHIAYLGTPMSLQVEATQGPESYAGSAALTAM